MANKAKPLLIVESPTKAQTIRRLLGQAYEVTASQGHVRDLPEKGMGLSIEKSEKGYVFTPTYTLLPKKAPIIQKIRQQVAEASSVWLATDEDREGEAIAWHLCHLLEIDPTQPVRITFHEITRRALQEALKSPRPINQNLVNAQQARRLLDRIVGYEISPLLWRTFPKSQKGSALSAGRVQSVALRLLVEREREIAQFRPEAILIAEIFLATEPAFKATLHNPPLKNKEEALSLLQRLVGRLLQVNKLEKKPRRRNPPPPFTTSTLQQEAQRRLGFSLSRTMRTAQSLYEKGLITYMRTDSTHLAPEALQAIHAALRERFGPQAVQPRTWEKKSLHAQEAHEAIRPTDPSVENAGDTPDEQKLYALIWRRTLASQMREALYEETLVELLPEPATEPLLTFVAKGRLLTEPGFLALYGYAADEEEEATLPPLREGQRLPWQQVRLWEKFSTPPPRYTEGTLVKELEERGIGRPSTYAPTVETLFKRAYIQRREVRVPRPPYEEILLMPDGQLHRSRQTPPPDVQKNKLLPTELGMRVVDFLVARFPDIMDYDFTAKVEAELDQIANAELDWQAMLNAFYERFTAELTQAQATRETATHKLLGYHPVSGKPITLRASRNGPYIAIGEKGDPDYRTASVPDTFSTETLTLEDALLLLSFPREVGTYEGAPIGIYSGPYGYYLKHNGQNYPLLPGFSPFSLTEEEAIQCIEARRAGQKSFAPLKTFPDAGIEILPGRYGPYIRYAGQNYAIPKGFSPAELTLEDCQNIIAQHQNKKQKASATQKRSYKK